jgi:hypothetical protein
MHMNDLKRYVDRIYCDVYVNIYIYIYVNVLVIFKTHRIHMKSVLF